MSLKTILIIIITVLTTVILMNNTEEIDFWLFGDTQIPKLTILGGVFIAGTVVGFLAGRPGKKNAINTPEAPTPEKLPSETVIRHQLSDEDRDYID